MSRTLDEILMHADQLAARLDRREGSGIRFEGSLHRVGRAFRVRAEAELDLAIAVVDARAGGHTWAEIGSFLGTSGEAASKKYRREIPHAPGSGTVVQLRMPLTRTRVTI